MTEMPAIFGYGSLVSARSAAETLGREVTPRPARLQGWRRAWSLIRDNERSEKRFVRLDGAPLRWCVALDAFPDPGSEAPNGALIELEASELERIGRRELRYDRVEVGAQVRLADGERPAGPVYVWRAKPEHHRIPPPPGAAILASYLEAVEAAFSELGADELERFRRTTGPPPVEVVPARLALGDAIPDGNPRRW